MPSAGWDQTNFGLFSGDDQLGGVCGKRVYEKVEGARQRSGSSSPSAATATARRAARRPNWSGHRPVDFVMESSVFTMLRYIKEGRIKVDKSRNKERGHLPRLLQPRPQLRHHRGAARAAPPGGRRTSGDDPQPDRELLLHRRRRRHVDVRVHAAAARLGQGQGRPDRGHRRQDRGDLVPQLRRRPDRPHQALQARLRGQAARGPGRRRAGHRRGVRGEEEARRWWSRSPGPPRLPLAGRRILVVDDEADVRDLPAHRARGRRRRRSIEAADGDEALAPRAGGASPT